MADEITYDVGPQQVQPPQQNIIIPPIDEKFGRWIESSDDLVTALVHDLKCQQQIFEQDPGTGEIRERWVTSKGTKPLMNDEGIMFVVSEIRSMCNKNTYFSNLEEKRVFDICRFTSISITNNIYSKLKRFGIQDTILADNIVEKINNTMELALRRAMGAKERSGLLKTFTTSENIQSIPKSQQQGSGGFFGLGGR